MKYNLFRTREKVVDYVTSESEGENNAKESENPDEQLAENCNTKVSFTVDQSLVYELVFLYTLIIDSSGW